MKNIIIILEDIKNIEDGRIDNFMSDSISKLFIELLKSKIKTKFNENEDVCEVIKVLDNFSSDTLLFRCLNIFNSFLQDTKYFYSLLEGCKDKGFKKSIKFISNNSSMSFLEFIGHPESVNLQIEHLYDKFKNKNTIINNINKYDRKYKLKKFNNNFKNYKVLDDIFSEEYDEQLFLNLCKNENIKYYLSSFKDFHDRGINFIKFINVHKNIVEKYNLIDFIIEYSHNEKFLDIDTYKLRYQHIIYDKYTSNLKEMLYSLKYNEIRRMILGDLEKFKEIISVDFLKYNVLNSTVDKNGILFIKFLFNNKIFSVSDVEFIYNNITQYLKTHLKSLLKSDTYEEKTDVFDSNYSKYYVYRFLDSENRILYIGKTCNLWDRMNSHKSNSHIDSECILNTKKIEFIETSSDSESCIYEIYYISKLNPIYNKEYNISTHVTFDIPEKSWHTYNFSMSNKVKNNKLKAFCK